MQKTAYGFDKNGDLPMVAIHVFRDGADGQLEHLIDGKLRATVPPEGWNDYVREYPDAADVVSFLRKPLDIAKETKEDISSDSQSETSPAA